MPKFRGNAGPYPAEHRWRRVIATLVVVVVSSACTRGDADRAVPDGADPVAGVGSAANGSRRINGSDGSFVADTPVEAVDDAGRTVRLSHPAARIVSIVPAATETLVAIGAGDVIVGRTDFDDASLEHLPSVGGGLTPSIEVIASLRPDLVIVWEEAGTARVRPRLESLGIPVFAVATVDSADIFANIERLGRLAGRNAGADSLAIALRRELDTVHRSVAGRAPPDVLYMISLEPPMVAGPELFIGELVEVAGGRNLFADVTMPSPQVSLEEIVRRRPDVVILPASGDGEKVVDRVITQPGWREIAASGARFIALPADTLHRPGPGIGAAARRIRDAIHPDLAPAR
jgi:ABC-type Fe3+-hydroxamate transport system substrate-binding protein